MSEILKIVDFHFLFHITKKSLENRNRKEALFFHILRLDVVIYRTVQCRRNSRLVGYSGVIYRDTWTWNCGQASRHVDLRGQISILSIMVNAEKQRF